MLAGQSITHWTVHLQKLYLIRLTETFHFISHNLTTPNFPGSHQRVSYVPWTFYTTFREVLQLARLTEHI